MIEVLQCYPHFLIIWNFWLHHVTSTIPSNLHLSVLCSFRCPRSKDTPPKYVENRVLANLKLSQVPPFTWQGKTSSIGWSFKWENIIHPEIGHWLRMGFPRLSSDMPKSYMFSTLHLGIPKSLCYFREGRALYFRSAPGNTLHELCKIALRNWFRGTAQI
jgi:hypothetical protein